MSFLRRGILVACALLPVLYANVAHAADPPTLAEGQHFKIDPIVDGVATVSGTGFVILLEAVISTGELRPQTVAPGSADKLLGIDRIAVTQKLDSSASMYSDIGRAIAIGYAVLDPILSGARDGWDAFLVDGFMFAESASITVAVTDMTKIAVRRPRPIDYLNPASTSTDSELSFFSGHVSGIAAVGSTATYLAFVRSGRRSPRPWLTLAGTAMLTSFVGYERVRAGAHFPTDVICGAMAGAAVGIIVPHLHRHENEAPPVWIGVTPAPSGALVSLQGFL
jgi:undecaprenyl-diphosphatase